MTYLLDANTYIQAKSLHYRMHIVPGFWEWLDLQFPRRRRPLAGGKGQGHRRPGGDQ
ncbi:DUF4411 family protein [Halomonas tibetensis]|uniref:DUF4411 family protein n=1 Tax=Halomonas tibetensis TaxID=2259590 RepID=A0ABV7B9V9_9GAMM